MGQILRKDVPEEQVWNLKDIFKSDEDWEKAFTSLKKEINVLTTNPMTLDDSQKLLDGLNRFDKLLVSMEQVHSYAFFKYSEDESDPLNQQRNGRAQSLMGDASVVKSQFLNAILAIPQETIKTFMEENKKIKEFDKFLSRIDEIRGHMLSPSEEKILATLGPSLHSMQSIYLASTSSDVKFDSVKDRNNNDVPVSIHMYFTQIETSADTVLRRNAYRSLSEGLDRYQHGFAKLLSIEINKNISIAKMRGFSSAPDMFLQYSSPLGGYATDGMDSSYFGEILDVFCHELSPHMQRYARLRKKLLGLDELLFADVKAPLDASYDPKITYKEAGEIITAAVGVLGPEYQQEMQRAFDEKWVYTGDNVGRRMIAFGGGVHDVHGYSFYPFGGSLFDLMLLGHELGHTIHYSLSAKNQRSLNNAQSLLFVESPSTLVEHLIVDYLMETSDDPRLKRWLNMYLMMSYHHNCVTHVLEAELLRRLYKSAEKGQPLTTAIISNTKGEILTEFWGDTVVIDEGAKLTWMRQPHYYMGVYPFTYSVGMSASTVMAQRIKQEGISAGEQWTNVLKTGGKKNGFELYNLAGLDMSTTDNLKKAVAHVGTIVDKLEQSF
ncbi:MAG TPA: M3 family metallopeptidase [Bacillota bacterium]|nr:M3 family metallopeptidase [Bacillota bacterium]